MSQALSISSTARIALVRLIDDNADPVGRAARELLAAGAINLHRQATITGYHLIGRMKNRPLWPVPEREEFSGLDRAMIKVRETDVANPGHREEPFVLSGKLLVDWYISSLSAANVLLIQEWTECHDWLAEAGKLPPDEVLLSAWQRACSDPLNGPQIVTSDQALLAILFGAAGKLKPESFLMPWNNSLTSNPWEGLNFKQEKTSRLNPVEIELIYQSTDSDKQIEQCHDTSIPGYTP